MKFKAELKKAELVKKTSLDNEYRVVLVTDNPQILDLGKLPYDTMFKVDMDIDNE